MHEEAAAAEEEKQNAKEKKAALAAEASRIARPAPKAQSSASPSAAPPPSGAPVSPNDADMYGAGGGGTCSATWASQQSREDPLDASGGLEYDATRPPRRLRPRSSGGFVHSRAQCPTWPHLAHLLRDLILVIVHLRGGAVRRGPFLENLFFGLKGAGPLSRGGPERFGGPRLPGRPDR